MVKSVCAALLETLDNSAYLWKAGLARHQAILGHDSVFSRELQAVVHVGRERKVREQRAEET